MKYSELLDTLYPADKTKSDKPLDETKPKVLVCLADIHNSPAARQIVHKLIFDRHLTRFFMEYGRCNLPSTVKKGQLPKAAEERFYMWSLLKSYVVGPEQQSEKGKPFATVGKFATVEKVEIDGETIEKIESDLKDYQWEEGNAQPDLKKLTRECLLAGHEVVAADANDHRWSEHVQAFNAANKTKFEGGPNTSEGYAVRNWFAASVVKEVLSTPTPWAPFGRRQVLMFGADHFVAGKCEGFALHDQLEVQLKDLHVDVLLVDENSVDGMWKEVYPEQPQKILRISADGSALLIDGEG